MILEPLIQAFERSIMATLYVVVGGSLTVCSGFILAGALILWQDYNIGGRISWYFDKKRIDRERWDFYGVGNDDENVSEDH